MRKLFRNYSYIEVTSMTATIKLKNHNVESLKSLKKFLGLLLDIQKVTPKIEICSLYFVSFVEGWKI